MSLPLAFTCTYDGELERLVKRFEKRLDNAADMIGQALVEAVEDRIHNGYNDPHGEDGHTEIYDTGTLLDSITYTAERTGDQQYEIVFGADMTPVNRSGQPYAIYVHDGTSKLHGRPFLRDAVNDINADIGQKVKDALSV